MEPLLLAVTPERESFGSILRAQWMLMHRLWSHAMAGLSHAGLLLGASARNYAASEFGFGQPMSIDTAELGRIARAPPRSGRRGFTPEAASGGGGGGRRRESRERRRDDRDNWDIQRLEDNPFWWKIETEALCFDLPLTPELELTDGAPAMSQWWDVEKLAESDNFVAISKPAGMWVITEKNALWEAVPTNFVHVAHQKFDMPSRTEPRQRGICHRLDHNTSGVQIFGNTWEAFQHFAAQNIAHRMQKEYIVLVHGRLGSPNGPDIGIIDVPMKKWQDFSRREFGSVIDARAGCPAVSKYKVLRQWRVPARGNTKFWGKDRWFTLVQMRILTGRTHQIRVHMAYIGHPLVCDEKYNPSCLEHDSAIVPRIFLHCVRMEFQDMDGDMFRAASELSPDLQVALRRIHSLSDATGGGMQEPSSSIAADGGPSFPGLTWILENSKAAAPGGSSGSEEPACHVVPKPILHRSYLCQEWEEASCTEVRKNSETAFVWQLLPHSGAHDEATAPQKDADPAWGPECLWIPTELRQEKAAELQDLEEAGPAELGEEWGVSAKWAWAHNGIRQNGWIHLLSGGTLSSKWGLGTWQIIGRCRPPLLLIMFSQVEHALRLVGAGTYTPSFEMVARRRLDFETSLAQDPDSSVIERLCDPEVPTVTSTRGWPWNDTVPASGGA